MNAIELRASRALQRLIIEARSMAHRNESHQRIADILDHLDYLSALQRDLPDAGDKFRAYLCSLGSEYPGANVALAYYDGTDPTTIL
ncbi:hypothetical protein WMF30_42655 [Sorangium sp. So ce134]